MAPKRTERPLPDRIRASDLARSEGLEPPNLLIPRLCHAHPLRALPDRHRVNADGCREILGIDVTSSEDGAGWLAFLRGLVARGLSGVALVISDDHAGLVNAIAAVLPGAA